MEWSKDASCPDYPFSPGYVPGGINNSGSMIIDKNGDDKLNWKRVLRMDLTANYERNDKFLYRSWIRWILLQIEQDNCALKAEDRLKYLITDHLEELQLKGNEVQDKPLFDLLLCWCKKEDWSEFFTSAARIGEQNEVFLLSGEGARMDKSYQELHLMLLRDQLSTDYLIKACDDHGYLTLQKKTGSEDFYLRFINDHIDAVFKSKVSNEGESVKWEENISKYLDIHAILTGISSFLTK